MSKLATGKLLTNVNVSKVVLRLKLYIINVINILPCQTWDGEYLGVYLHLDFAPCWTLYTIGAFRCISKHRLTTPDPEDTPVLVHPQVQVRSGQIFGTPAYSALLLVRNFLVLCPRCAWVFFSFLLKKNFIFAVHVVALPGLWFGYKNILNHLYIALIPKV